MIATAQEQFRAQNPYYQAPPAPGEIRDEAFEGSEDGGGQPGQGQPIQGQPPQRSAEFRQPAAAEFQQFAKLHQQPTTALSAARTATALRWPTTEFESLSRPPAASAAARTSLIARRHSNSSRRNRLPRPPMPANCRPSSPARSRSRTRKPRDERLRQPGRRPLSASPPAPSSRPGWPWWHAAGSAERAAGIPWRRRPRRAGQHLTATEFLILQRARFRLALLLIGPDVPRRRATAPAPAPVPAPDAASRA